MKVGEISQHPAVRIGIGASLGDAVERMCSERVGTAIITRNVEGRPIVVGILTDRDILRAQLQRAAEFSQLNVEDAMTRDPLLVRSDEELGSVLVKLQARSVRRAPIVDQAGAAVGLVSVDDLLQHIAKQINGIAGIIAGQTGTVGAVPEAVARA